MLIWAPLAMNQTPSTLCTLGKSSQEPRKAYITIPILHMTFFYDTNMVNNIMLTETMAQDENVTQFVDCLPTLREVLGLVRIVRRTSIIPTLKVQAERPGVQNHPQLHTQSKVSLKCMRPCLKKAKEQPSW